MKIAIINTFSSNIQSVINALAFLGYKKFQIIESINDYDPTFTHIIFPGVGTFESNMKSIIDKKIDIVIKESFKNNKFYLGICIGMQILATTGEENGNHQGLDIIEGTVQRLQSSKLPHIGWNEVHITINDNLLKDITTVESFYFVHSYFFNSKNKELVLATTNYGNNFSSIVKKNNFYGVQFHPEKSQFQGLKLIKNFLNLR